MSNKLEIPQIMQNVTNDRFGMCQICNKAKWCHTNDEEVSCNTQIMIEDLKNEIKKLKEELTYPILFFQKHFCSCLSLF